MVELISTRFLHLSLQLWVELAQSYPKTHKPIESLGIRDPTVQLETPQPDMRTLDAQTTAAVVDTVCTNHCAHVSHIFAAVPQRMAARSTLVCIVQGRNSFVTLGNSEGVRNSATSADFTFTHTSPRKWQVSSTTSRTAECWWDQYAHT